MERSVALKKLSKMLGKGFGYRMNAKAPSREEREAATVELKVASAELTTLGEKLEARRKEILGADPEYQELRKATEAARKRRDNLNGIRYSQKICVGNSNGLFFRVAAEGDSWEEVITEVKRKKEKNQLW